MKLFESELARIPDILAVRSVNEGDERREIHVLASPGREAHDIVSDIESLAVLRGIPLDPGGIHVVQLQPIRNQHGTAEMVEPDDIAAVPAPAAVSDRIEIDGVLVASGEGTARAVATVRVGSQIATGTSVFVPAGSALRRGVADATLCAVLELLDARAEIAVDAAHLIPLPPHEIALVTLAVVNGAGEQTLVGAAVVRSAGVNDAIARAVLDATNRWFKRHVEPPP